MKTGLVEKALKDNVVKVEVKPAYLSAYFRISPMALIMQAYFRAKAKSGIPKDTIFFHIGWFYMRFSTKNTR